MLEGTNVRLRAYEMSDLDRVYKWVNDLEVTQFLSITYPLSRRDEESWLRERKANNIANAAFAIETMDGVHIGNISLQEIRAEDSVATLGIMIGEKDYWSSGFGTDAIVTLLRFAFEEMGLHRVSLHVNDFNARGIACYRKCGFQEEARLRDNAYIHGRYWDVLAMGILRDEFTALHGASEAPGIAEATA
jgi:RimJ/RimL family protein N-acetyltransferase